MAGGSDKSNIYHRTIDLQIDFGCDVLKKFMQTKLDKSNTTLTAYLNQQHVRSSLEGLKNIYKEQLKILYPYPNILRFDCSLLTTVLLNGCFSLTKKENQDIKRLRELRNTLSHVPKAELDETHFIEASNLIIEIANMCGKDFGKQVKQKIGELKAKELVTVKSNIEIVKLRAESYMVKLVKSDNGVKTDTSDTTLLRYGLTKWIKRFTNIVELDSLMKDLKKEGVLSSMERIEIEKNYNKAEQCNALIMKMDDGSDTNLRKFFRCLRSKHVILADLIENKADDGASIERELDRELDETIKSAIHQFFETNKSGRVLSEDVHIVVEEELRHGIPFSLIEVAVKEEFGVETNTDFWIDGIEWKRNRDEALNTLSNQVTQTEDEKHDAKENFVSCTCEEFGEKVSNVIEAVKGGYGLMIKEAIVEECISPKTFSKLNDSEMKIWLAEYMKGRKFILGVFKELTEIRKIILDELQKSQCSQIDVRTELRALDTIGVDMSYHCNEIVKPPLGNLLVPAHEFRTFSGIRTSSKAYIIKECVRFVCACINARKNGTIHFGIEPIESGRGKIQGVKYPQISENIDLDLWVEHGIETCFEPHHVLPVKRCIRPFQRVLVDDDSIVLEMDVVPSSPFTDDLFCTIKFPPKGKQIEQTFVYTVDLCPEIMNIPHIKLEESKALYADNPKERKLLEDQVIGATSTVNKYASELQRRITADSKYITDQYVPVVFCGKLKGTNDEENIRKIFDMNMGDLFKSSRVIFDFDQSPRTRRSVEENTSAWFQVRTTEGDGNIADDIAEDACWIYCNGYSELNLEEMDINNWLVHRSSVIKQALAHIRAKIPQRRALLIFMFFEGSTDYDIPLPTIAEECMITSFRNECIVISSSPESVEILRSKVLNRQIEGEDFEQHFHTNLSWKEISRIMAAASRASCIHSIQLPCSDGTIVSMNPKRLEKMNLTDIEIVSGTQCSEFDDKDKESIKDKKVKEEKSFYRGDEVSWWNFHFDDQVGKRDMYPVILKSVKDKIRNGKNLIEIKTVMHQPGAGGTTAGRHLIWRLSQFRYLEAQEAYRCCTVRQITERTAHQIYEFMSFEDDTPKSAVVLIDNLNEERITFLREGLYQKAYKTPRQENNVFCLLIVVQRKMLAYDDKPTDHLLKHNLSPKEQVWFEKKYKELENAKEIDVNTLISFNVMRNSFDTKYIQELVRKFLDGVRKCEMPVLKCLALINNFDRDTVIPLTILDYLLSGRQTKAGLQLGDCFGKGPVGLALFSFRNKSTHWKGSPWSRNVTEEFLLLTKQRFGKTSKIEMGCEYPGVTMISHPLAKAVLNRIMELDGSNYQKLIQFVLQIVKEHVKETNLQSKEFVKIVNSLFKTRQILPEEGEHRAKFSEMITQLTRTPIEGEDNNTIVIDLMKDCFSITQDAMVGQQLSRFYISLERYEEAEETIETAIEIQPKSSYLLDTYGQIFYSQMYHILLKKSAEYGKISNEDAGDIVGIAFKALDKFKAAQTISSEREDSFNFNCYTMEVKTILHLLENFFKFSCHQEESDLLNFLNNIDFSLPDSYSGLLSRFDLKQLTLTSDTITHVNESLRFLEESDYQLKHTLVDVRNSKNEKLPLKLRERFERFYGSVDARDSFKFKFGCGLKSLMVANEAEPGTYKKRVNEAVIKLNDNDQRAVRKHIDKRDLLVVLGHTIIEMSTRRAKRRHEVQAMDKEQYKSLVRYTERLLEEERSAKRPYLEAFLYYTMLNWPTKSREVVENLGKTEKLKNVLKEWKEAFTQNFQTLAQKKDLYPKTFFALGNGPLGNDLVDFGQNGKMWRETTGEDRRQYVQDDQVWESPDVQKILKRLNGTMNDSGTYIRFEIKLQHWSYQQSISCQQQKKHLSNRRVSFILVFTWAGPKAADIKEIADETDYARVSSQEEKGAVGEEVKESNQDHETKEGRSPKRKAKGKASDAQPSPLEEEGAVGNDTAKANPGQEPNKRAKQKGSKRSRKNKKK